MAHVSHANFVPHWLLLSIIWGILLPYITRSLYHYIKYKRSKVYFTKRKPFLIDLVVGLVVSGIFLENQTLIFLSIYYHEKMNDAEKSQNFAAAEIVRLFNICAMIAIYMIIMIRIYLLYFQSQYNEAAISQKWKEYVNEAHEDFFLENIHTYGDDKFLLRLSAIVWILLSVFYVAFEWRLPDTGIANWFILVLFFMLFVFAIYIWRKFPNFQDTLHIRRELKYFLVLNFVLLFALMIVLLTVNDLSRQHIAKYYLQVLMYTLIFWISIDKVIAWNEVQQVDIKRAGLDENSIYYRQMTDSTWNLQEVIATQKGYEQFMQFLVSEFSTENLLFVTEYLQLKSLLSLSDREMRSLKLTFHMELPLNLPTPKMIEDLNLDLEQIRRNQQFRKEKKLKRQKELKKKLIFEIKRQNSSENLAEDEEYEYKDEDSFQPTDDDDDDDKEAQAQQSKITLQSTSSPQAATYSNPSAYGSPVSVLAHAPVSLSGVRKTKPMKQINGTTDEELHFEQTQDVNPANRISVTAETVEIKYRPSMPAQTGGIGIIEENVESSPIEDEKDKDMPPKPTIDGITINSNSTVVVSDTDKQAETPSVNNSEAESTIVQRTELVVPNHENQESASQDSKSPESPDPVSPSSADDDEMRSLKPTPKKTESELDTKEEEEEEDEDMVIVSEEDEEPVIITVDRTKSAMPTMARQVSAHRASEPVLKAYKTLSDAGLRKKDQLQVNSKQIRIDVEPESFKKVQSHSMDDTVEEPKLQRPHTDLPTPPTAAKHATLSSNKYSKDDFEIRQLNKAGSPRQKRERPQSLSIRFNKRNSDKEVKPPGPKLSLSDRVQSKSNILKHQIRQKSRKMKSGLEYHMREASNSMALKSQFLDKLQTKRGQQFNVLDCKAFSSMCTKLYYKYIATGVAPLEVNISAANRQRCYQTFSVSVGGLSRQTSTSKSSGGTSSGKRPRTVSRGVVELMSNKRNTILRHNAIELLRDTQAGGTTAFKSTKSKKKLSMTNSEEPFDGDIVVAMTQLLPPLEQCAIELSNLLKDSLQRFKTTESCIRLYEDYLERKETERLVNVKNVHG